MTVPLMQPDLCARRARDASRRDAARRARYRYLAEGRGSWIAAERRRWRWERILAAVRRGVPWLLAGGIGAELGRWAAGWIGGGW